MLTIAPVTFTVVPRIASAPADLVKQRDEADSDARWAQREMVLGSVVSKAGKATMVAGLGVTGLGLLGAPLRERLGRVWDAAGSGTLWAGLFAAPAVLTAAFGAPGFMAGMAADLLGFRFLASGDDGGAAMIGGAAIAGLSGAVGAAGPWGAGIACAAGVAMGVNVARGVWKGTSEAWS